MHTVLTPHVALSRGAAVLCKTSQRPPLWSSQLAGAVLPPLWSVVLGSWSVCSPCLGSRVFSYGPFTHACRFREDPLFSWTLAENCYAVLSCRVLSSCCCASVFVAKCDTWRTGAYNFNLSTRLHESQRHQASNGPLLLYRLSQSCRVGFRPNSELGFAIGRPSFEIPRSFMHQGPQGRSLLLTEKAR